MTDSKYFLLIIDGKERKFITVRSLFNYIVENPQLHCFEMDVFLCSKQYLCTIKDPCECEARHAE